MTNKKKPERMCMVCRSHMQKDELLRIVKNKDGEIFVDATYKAAGRGAYICKNTQCIENAEKKNALSRAFKMNVGSEIYEQIRKITD